ncbi:hypothetical protein RJ639_038084 [Escallonia herrerae]|uniref:Annexin n=1 Tax=Escallonia herrerae TaxID=1293975 RepID=A0AA89B6M1_9ASTE|nr:hypothetical protein RJ639_038084 [Escallonia herrerae]
MTMSSQNCKTLCKKIHDSKGQLNHLAQALEAKTQVECQEIRRTYMEMYGKDLHQLLKSIQLTNQGDEAGASSYECATALSMLMLSSHERDAVVAREALEQSAVNFKAVLEIFLGRKSSHVILILQAYQTRFNRKLEQDISSIEPPHPYQMILRALASSHKAHHAVVSEHIGRCDARRLYQTGEGRPGAIDEAVVLEILSKRSVAQLSVTFSSYKHIYGHSYTKSLKKGNHGQFEEALKAVVSFISNPPKYYAKTLYRSIKGATMEKGSLARVMVSRAEVDMNEIQMVFKKKYGMELRDAIWESIPSGGAYRVFVVALATKTTSS